MGSRHCTGFFIRTDFTSWPIFAFQYFTTGGSCVPFSASELVALSISYGEQITQTR